jgi:transcriptional regulator with XRE-family HTH domain
MPMSERIRLTLKAARVNAGLTQKDVADRLHISVQSLVKWESGEVLPTVDRAGELADLYGLLVDDIIFCRKSQI